jgi:hypothetical protein
MGRKLGSGYESLEIIFFGFKIPKFFDADPGWKNSDLGSGNRDKHPGSGTLMEGVLYTETYSPDCSF